MSLNKEAGSFGGNFFKDFYFSQGDYRWGTIQSEAKERSLSCGKIMPVSKTGHFFSMSLSVQRAHQRHADVVKQDPGRAVKQEH